MPDRVVDGYGLTASIAQARESNRVQMCLITVDNGIASIEGVTPQPKALGMQVLMVTDHHLPTATGA